MKRAGRSSQKPPVEAPSQPSPEANTGEGYHQKFIVAFDYPVHFTRRVFQPGNPLLVQVLKRRRENRRHRVFACIDSGVAESHPHLVRQIKDYFHQHHEEAELVGSPELIPGGEAAKNSTALVRDLMITLGNHHLDRQSFVLAIGGGSVLDVAGFAASLVHRGLRLIRMPTTVLAQNDAGVGVKTGINEHGQKNFLGTFAPPFAVIDDFAFLATLPDAHWRGGIAEALKVAIIEDRGFFELLCDRAALLGRRDQAAMEELIRRCAVLHLQHIAMSGDPFEMGTARPLDFGHWAAHKLEILSAFQIPHGDAVAAGIALDSFYAMKKGLISGPDLMKILAALNQCGFPLWYPEMERRSGGGLLLLEGLKEFQEHLGGSLTITLPDSIGRKCEVHQVNTDLIEEGIAFLKNYAAGLQRSSA